MRSAVVMDDVERLLELNRLMFVAESRPAQPIEGKTWEAFLSGVLAEDFLGRRGKASLPHQDRDAFVAFAHDASDLPREVVGDPAVWLGADVGVVACDVRLGDDDTVHFRNLKAFARRGDWQCVYWQVTPFEHAVS